MGRRLISKRRGGPSSSLQLENGLYQDGTWWCNCNPRQPAVQQTSSTRKNPGRAFYGCPHLRRGCDFFLWRSDADRRAPPDNAGAGALEPVRNGGPFTMYQAPPPAPWPGQQQQQQQQQQPYRNLPRAPSDQSIGRFFRREEQPKQETASGSEEHHHHDRQVDSLFVDGKDNESSYTLSGSTVPHPDLFGDDDDDGDMLDHLSSGEEKSLLRMAERIVGQSSPGAGGPAATKPGATTPPPPPSPANKKRKLAHRVFMSSDDEEEDGNDDAGAKPPSTPSRPRTQITAGLATPVTGNRTAKRKRTDDDPTTMAGRHGNISGGTGAAEAWPRTPSSGDGGGRGGGGGGAEGVGPDMDSISPLVIPLLQSQKIDPLVLGTIRDLLGRHDARVKGIRSARDMLREGWKRKEERIAELEAKLRSNMAMMANLKKVLSKEA